MNGRKCCCHLNSSRMGDKTKRLEILVVSMIFTNICVIVLLLNTQMNGVDKEQISKTQSLPRSNAHEMKANQLSRIHLTSQYHQEDANKYFYNNDRWDYKQRNDLKTSNNPRNSNNLPVLYQYCPEGGTMLGNVDKSFSLFDNTVVKIGVFSHKQNKYAFHFKRMKQLKF